MIIQAPANIKTFLKNRVKEITSKLPDKKFIVENKDPRKLVLDDNFSKIIISAKNITNLKNDFNRIGLLQAFYRFVGLNSLAKGLFLLHASAAVLNNKAVIFGDNGKSIGKTTSSVETALIDKKYLADEFVFWESKTNGLLFDTNIPIHFREDVGGHFREVHNLNVKADFIEPDKLGFSCPLGKVKADIICYVNFLNKAGLPRIVKLSKDSALEYATQTFSAHIKKFLNPELDRFKFLSQKEKVVIDKPYDETKDRRLALFTPFIKKSVQIFTDFVDSYELFVNSSCEIPALLTSNI